MLGLRNVGPVRAVCYRVIFKGIFETDELAELLRDMPPPRLPLLSEWRRTAHHATVAVGLIFLRAVLSTASRPADRERQDASPRFHFPKVWELFPFILGRSLRTEVYEPAHEELKEDYVLALRHTGRRERRWLTFAFTCRTAHLVLLCIWVGLGGRVTRALGALFEELIRRPMRMG
jgi:hypothetical protein